MPKPRTRDPRDTRNAPPRTPKEAATAIPPRAAAVPAPPIPADPPPRTYKVEWASEPPLGPSHFLVVRITNGTAANYLVERLAAGVFAVRKLAAESLSRTVSISPASCPCKGFLHHGTCKHVEVLLSLREKGRV